MLVYICTISETGPLLQRLRVRCQSGDVATARVSLRRRGVTDMRTASTAPTKPDVVGGVVVTASQQHNGDVFEQG